MTNQSIEDAVDSGNLDAVKEVFSTECAQAELDHALEVAIAYSHTDIADFLIEKGADISANGHQGIYFAAFNGELDGVKYALTKGVDINAQNGLILNTAIETALNSQDLSFVEWVLSHGADASLVNEKNSGLLKDGGFPELAQRLGQ